MPIEIRPPTPDDLEAMFQADARAFGEVFSAAEIAERRGMFDLSRFRLALDGKRIVGTAGAFSLELTLPGGAFVPAAGVTWVSTQPTHRRQGIMTGLLDSLHRDAADRGDPVAILTASESGIYGRFGYGVSSYLRSIAITKHQARFRSDAPGAGAVWFADSGDEARHHVVPRYEAYRRTQPGEISRDPAMWDLLFGVRSRSLGSLSPAFWLLHADGYCAYRMQDGWNLGQPAHVAEVVEFVALTDDARGALWRTMLSIDLVTEVQQRFSQIDDPLPYWLESPRSVRTTAYNDYLWVKPLEPAVLLAARTYGTADRLVVEVGATRWAVDAAGDEVEVRKVRTRPDITVTDAGLGSLLLGGARATTLARVGAMSGEPAAVRRADRFFLGDRLPSSQTGF